MVRPKDYLCENGSHLWPVSVGLLVRSKTLFRCGLGLVEFGFTFAGKKRGMSTCFAEIVHFLSGSTLGRRSCYKLDH